MLSIRKFRLCLFDQKKISVLVTGRMPQFSESTCYASYSIKETGQELFRYDATPGTDPSFPMVAINEIREVESDLADLTLIYTVLIPEESSTMSSSLSFHLFTPIFQPSFIVNGVDQRCLESSEPPTISVEGINIFARRDQAWIARQIEQLYISKGPVIDFFLSLRPSVDRVIAIGPDSTQDGGICIVKQSSTMLVLKIGTTATEQLIGQGQAFLLGPQNWMSITTSSYWAPIAIKIAQQIDAIGFAGINHMVFSGHSLGGAVLCILAAWIKIQRPQLKIDVLTYGCPLPGGSSLAQVLGQTNMARIENDGDPVPYLPPVIGNMGAITAGLLPLNKILLMSLFRSPKGRYLLFPDGQMQYGEVEAPDRDIIDQAVKSWIGLASSPDFPAHDMKEYRTRLELG